MAYLSVCMHIIIFIPESLVTPDNFIQFSSNNIYFFNYFMIKGLLNYIEFISIFIVSNSIVSPSFLSYLFFYLFYFFCINFGCNYSVITQSSDGCNIRYKYLAYTCKNMETKRLSNFYCPSISKRVYLKDIENFCPKLLKLEEDDDEYHRHYSIPAGISDA